MDESLTEKVLTIARNGKSFVPAIWKRSAFPANTFSG